MIAIAGLAGCLAMVQTDLGMFLIGLLIWGGLSWAAWRVGRLSGGWALGVLAGLGTPIDGLTFQLSLQPPHSIGQAVPFMLAFVSAPWLVAPAWAWFLAERPPGPLARRVIPAAVLLIVAFPLVTAITLWPLRARFFLVRPAPDRLADRVAAGAPVGWPAQVGPYTFVSGTADATNPRNVALFLDADPNGPYGMIRLVGPPPPYGGTSRLIVPTAYDIPLTSGWHLMSED